MTKEALKHLASIIHKAGKISDDWFASRLYYRACAIMREHIIRIGRSHLLKQMRYMKLKDYLSHLNKLVYDNPKLLEADVIYSIDDEGNEFKKVVYSPEVMNGNVCVN